MTERNNDIDNRGFEAGRDAGIEVEQAHVHEPVPHHAYNDDPVSHAPGPDPGQSGSDKGIMVLVVAGMAYLVFGALILFVASLTPPGFGAWVVGLGMLVWIAMGALYLVYGMGSGRGRRRGL
jgi:hypothetical protein